MTGRETFEVQGHRGARALFPENTLAGFRDAIGLGVRVIELDVAVTEDGTPVVFHDVALNPAIVRGPEGDWIDGRGPLLRALSDRELARYDVGRLRPGSAYAALFPRQVPRDGARIPSLADVFALTVPLGVRVDAELKTLPTNPGATVAPEAMARIVIETAARAGALGLLDIRSFDWRGVRAARGLQPGLPVTLLTNADSEAAPEVWWDRARGSPGRMVAAEWPDATWAPELATLTPERVAEAHGLGLRVVPWTVNRAEDLARMVAWGCDGVCTDEPDTAFAVARSINPRRP